MLVKESAGISENELNPLVLDSFTLSRRTSMVKSTITENVLGGTYDFFYLINNETSKEEQCSKEFAEAGSPSLIKPASSSFYSVNPESEDVFTEPTEGFEIN